MSKEAALAFLQKIAQDSDLQSKLVAFAAEQGYEFSVDELSEAELEASAGGHPVVGNKIDVPQKIRTDMTSFSGPGQT